MKFADPKNDVAFRKIFGNEAKKVVLISFLNSVLSLEGDRKIINLEFRNTFQLPRIVGLKSSIIDVNVKDQSGTTYIVEMQLSEVTGFDKRVQYYVSKEYASQIEKGNAVNLTSSSIDNIMFSSSEALRSFKFSSWYYSHPMFRYFIY